MEPKEVPIGSAAGGISVASDKSQTTGLAGRYATAAFELALEEKALDALARDLATIRALLDASEDFLRLVRSPVLTREEQSKALEAILGDAKAHALTRKFVLLLSRNRRLFILGDVIRAFETLVARHRGEIPAAVTSARPLNEAETAELTRILKEKLGREPILELKVDPKLLGGLVLKVGSRLIDSSLRTRLAGIRAAMRGS
ncbi:MAG: F0F1 ATP synthase subunit delta [Alphaproteobacteria bacterium]